MGVRAYLTVSALVLVLLATIVGVTEGVTTQNGGLSENDVTPKGGHSTQPSVASGGKEKKKVRTKKGGKAHAAPEAHEESGAHEESEAHEAPKAPEAPKVSKAPKAPKTPRTPKTPKTPKAPKAPKVSKTTVQGGGSPTPSVPIENAEPKCLAVQPDVPLKINVFQISAILSQLEIPKRCKNIDFSDFAICQDDLGKTQGCCTPSCSSFLTQITSQCWMAIGGQICGLEANQAAIMMDLLAKRCDKNKTKFRCMQTCDEREEIARSKLTITNAEFTTTVKNPKGCGLFKMASFQKCFNDFREERGCCSLQCQSVFKQITDKCWEGIREKSCLADSRQPSILLDLLSRRCDATRRPLICMTCEKEHNCQVVDNELEIAAEEGDVILVKKLIAEGAHVDYPSDYNEWTALMYAANEGHDRVVKALVAADANVDAHSTTGETALMLAAERGFVSVARILIKAGANVDAQDYGGWTALSTASIENQLKIVKILIAAGANVDLSTSNGETPLSVAREGGHKKIVQMLIQAGAS